MAATRETTASLIKPLGGAIVRRGTLGATTAAGEAVSLQADGKWDPAIGTSVVKTVGIAIQAGVDGDEIDIVRHGPVLCMSGATIGNWVYVNDTAGEFDETGGTKDTIIGYAETAAVLFVQPQIVDLS